MTVKEFVKHYGITGPQACVLLGYSSPQHLQRAKDHKNPAFFRNAKLRSIIKINNYLLDFYPVDKLIKLIEKDNITFLKIIERYKINDIDGTKLFAYSCVKSFRHAKAQNDSPALVVLSKLIHIMFRNQGLSLKEIFDVINQ